MRSAGIVLILSGIFIAAAVVHSKLRSFSGSSDSGSSSNGSGTTSDNHSITVALPGGGDVTVNASDPAAALANVQLETGQTGVGFLSGPGGTPVSG